MGLIVHILILESVTCEWSLSMSNFNDLSDQMSGLDIDEEENTAFIIEGDVEDEGKV